VLQVNNILVVMSKVLQSIIYR